MLESDYEYNEDAFSEKSIRQSFIRKVYSILSLQLIITVGICLIFVLVESANKYAKENAFVLLFGSLIAMVCTLIPFSCSQTLRRRVPHNFILLAIFTLAEAVSISVSVARFPNIALQALVITAVIVFALTLFAFQSKYDFTLWNGAMLCILLIFSVVGIILMFFPVNVMYTIYAGVGVFIFSIYLLIDTQMLIGGSHKYQISPEDYIFAALTIYLDIILIFLYIMDLLQAFNKD